MIPGGFEYHRPSSVDDVVALLAEYGDDGRVMAGGHSLIPMMKMRLAVPDHIIDLRDVAGLRDIRVDADTVTIGAMATQTDIIAHGDLAGVCPILRETALVIADPQVRNMGTVGGNVANGDPGNDLPAVMQCLDATYVLLGPGGRREVKARDFYQGVYVTDLGAGEFLTAVVVPCPAPGHGSAYEKLKRKVGDYATAAAAVVLTMDGGNCAGAAIALTNLGDTPLLAGAAAQALVSTAVDDAAVAAAAASAAEITDPVGDIRGSVEYRRKMTSVVTRRAILRALARARS